MKKTTYDQVNAHINLIACTFVELKKIRGFSSSNLVRDYNLVDPVRIAIDCDSFIEESPNNNKKYLNEFLDKLLVIKSEIDVLSEEAKYSYNVDYYTEKHETLTSRRYGFKSETNFEDFTGADMERVKNNSDLKYYLHQDVVYLIEHLQTILNPEINIQVQPQPDVKPLKGQSLLNREQTALLFFYQREIRITPQSTNGNMAKAITLLTGHSTKQVQDILRTSGTPSYQLGKDNDKVTRADFKILISAIKELLVKIEKDYRIHSDNNELR